jgi:two-component system nitrate/nitrite response regulator NarL
MAAREMTAAPRLAIVEDHELLAESLFYVLRDEGYQAAVIAASSLEDIERGVIDFDPDVVLMDLHLGDRVGSVLPLVKRLSAAGHRVVMITGVTDRARLSESIEAGAVGIISKAASFESLLMAIRDAVESDTMMSEIERQNWLAELRRYRAADELRKKPFERLTHREQEVLARLCDGHSANQIAEESYVALSTVRSQIRAVLMKLGVGSQLEAVAAARRGGWL